MHTFARQWKPGDQTHTARPKVQERGCSTQTPVPAIVHEALRSSGQPLDPPTRAVMESRFGHDFSQVRVHTDLLAARSAAAVAAQAYTVGSDVVFGAGGYVPTSRNGQHLLAHELTHVVQQCGAVPHIQRAPLDALDLETSTRGMHEQLADEFATATGTQVRPGSQYTPEYGQWLQAEANKYRFQPPTVSRQDPFDLLVNGQLNAHTFLTINGTKFPPGGTIATLDAQYQRAITPTSVTSEAEAAGVSCRFRRDFQIQTSAEIVVFTAPGAQGWQRTLNPNQVLHPADQPRCTGKTTVPVTLRGQPSDAAYAQTIEAGEMEHVQALEMLHNKHFVPYYHFVRSLRSTGSDASACAANLRQHIGTRAEQAALGFIFGDLAETRRFDDPAVGTHHARLTPTIDAGCTAITLTASLTRAQTPGLGPGNVRSIPPVSRPVDPTQLSVSGNDLTDGVTTLRSFSSPANANLALQVFQHYRITEMLRLGSFEFLLANGSAPSGSLAGLNERHIDPASYQVTFGVPGAADWSIVEVVPGQVNLIHNFGANRDQAYSAVELMQRHNFNREVWLGGANHPELKFFRKD